MLFFIHISQTFLHIMQNKPFQETAFSSYAAFPLSDPEEVLFYVHLPEWSWYSKAHHLHKRYNRIFQFLRSGILFIFCHFFMIVRCCHFHLLKLQHVSCFTIFFTIDHIYGQLSVFHGIFIVSGWICHKQSKAAPEEIPEAWMPERSWYPSVQKLPQRSPLLFWELLTYVSFFWRPAPQSCNRTFLTSFYLPDPHTVWYFYSVVTDPQIWFCCFTSLPLNGCQT